jgi:Icc-related predicted phosphoesterase
LIFWSNKVDGTLVSDVHAKKHDANDTADVTLSNKPDGTVVKVDIVANALANIVAFGE